MAREPIVRRFGHAVRKRRVEAGFSQESLAGAAKVHPTYISLIERGLRDPRLTSIAKLAKALKTSPADLMLEAKRGR